MAWGHRGGLQQQKQGQRKAGRSLRVRVSEAQGCAHPNPGLPASTGDETRVSAAAAPGARLSQHTHLGPTSPHTPAMGRSCPLTLYSSPPTLDPCSVTPARALESSSSFLPSDHALLPALRRAREPRPPLQGRLRSRPPSTSSPLGCSTGRDSSQPGSAWTPLPQGPRARRLGASPVLHTCLQPGHLPNLPLSTHLCVHFLV